MKKVIIIEDEKSASDFLISTLKEIDTGIEIVTTLPSVAKSIDYLSSPNVSADIIFSDVQLEDGLSFSIFSNKNINVPVIFITGYNQFMMNAFECNGIEYLLKPVIKSDLEKALLKYKKLESFFSQSSSPLNNLLKQFPVKKKTRLVVKRGLDHIFLHLDDVVLFYTENKVVFVVDKNGKKYLVDKNLGDLEMELDETIFFRANRQYLVNINYIKGYKTYERVKLQADLTINNTDHCIVISQETAPHFKKWLYEA
ncbi:MAG TPA: LytTR family DNA-binding domain-containing protein [Chitinophagaceae bacterium]|jgi:DNA-binding LytR/AlgR family response regulator|nr:LytTR family DNA-binding domain-containing protein [Chitinophagaceae bacterium]